MKLIGSKMEKDFRGELQKSRESFSSESRLRDALESQGHTTNNAYVLHWTPDQGEDIYVVLIEGAYLVSVELDRLNPETPPIFERIELKEYSDGLSRMYQVKLLVAQDLSSAKT